MGRRLFQEAWSTVCSIAPGGTTEAHVECLARIACPNDLGFSTALLVDFNQSCQHTLAVYLCGESLLRVVEDHDGAMMRSLCGAGTKKMLSSLSTKHPTVDIAANGRRFVAGKA